MRQLRRLLRRLRHLFRRGEVETEMAEEMRYHLDERAADLADRGLPKDDTQFAATRRFGNVASIQEYAREAHRWAWLENGLRDVRFTLRQFRRSPAFTATAITTLALCIGAATAIFSVLYAVILKPLPFDEPDRIVEIYYSATKTGIAKMPASVGIYRDYHSNAKSFETLALWQPVWPVFGEDGSLERMWGARATADIFGLLRVRPVLGGFFTTEQNHPGEDGVVVLMESFWESRYDRDPAILGRTIRIDRRNLIVVGVVDRAMEVLDPRLQFIQPLTWGPQAEHPNARYSLGITLFARLADGVSPAQADAEVKTMEMRYLASAPAQIRDFIENSGGQLHVTGMRAERARWLGPALYPLQAGALFVLLIGCVNVANLLLARASARRSELAIRVALGAGRRGLARQLLTESLVLTGLGAALGIGLAWVTLRIASRYISALLPASPPITFDWGILIFALGLTLASAIGIGLVPLVHLLRKNLSGLIQSTSRGASAGRGIRSVGSVLVIGQLAVALVLLTGAGLLIVAFQKAIHVDPGIDSHGVIGVTVNVSPAHRASDEAGQAIRDRLGQALQEIPGVTAVTMSFNAPFRGTGVLPTVPLTLADDPRPPDSPAINAYLVAATPGYPATMRLQVVEGRFFEPQDAPFALQRFVVDETFAHRFFPNGSAVGGRLSFQGRPASDADWPTIIGVVKNVPQNGVEDRSGTPFFYRYFAGHPGTFDVYVRTARPLADAMAAIRQKIRSVDPGIALDGLTTLEDAINDAFAPRRTIMLLLASFAGLALFLAMLGIYGVLAYDIAQRTREIGIRGAMGATRGQLMGLILKQGFWRVVSGLVIGLGAALLLSRYISSLLYDVAPTDPGVYAAVSLVLLVTALLASYLPARRAAKIDPIIALRTE